MEQGRIDTTRYRALVAALGLASGVAIGAAVLAWRVAGARAWEWGVFLLAAAVFLALIPPAIRARRKDARDVLERIAAVVLVVGGLAMLQRIAWVAFSGWLDDPAANPFRPVFHFLPLFYIATFALLRARRALTLCWASWALVAAITMAGLLAADGVSLQRDGALTLAIWLLLANPMFIAMLHGFPRFEEALEQSEAEVARMRERTELLDRLGESERRFNLVVQALQVGVWDRWVGPPERRWWSPRFYELIGYTAEELEASEENLKRLMHPEERENVWQRGTEQLAENGTMDVDFRLLTRHRGYRWFNSHGQVDRDAGGRIQRITGALTDIHEQRSAEAALHEAKAELTLLAYRDTLTDLNNRRAFDERFADEWQRSLAEAQPLSLLLIDLDHFKLFNDRYGHTAGDECLRRIARCIADAVRRPGLFAARLGGEEFAVILPQTTYPEARDIAQALAQAVRALAIPHDRSPAGRVTASVGASTSGAVASASARVLYERTDVALYEVKRRGRDGALHERDMGEPQTYARA